MKNYIDWTYYLIFNFFCLDYHNFIFFLDLWISSLQLFNLYFKVVRLFPPLDVMGLGTVEPPVLDLIHHRYLSSLPTLGVSSFFPGNTCSTFSFHFSSRRLNFKIASTCILSRHVFNEKYKNWWKYRGFSIHGLLSVLEMCRKRY